MKQRKSDTNPIVKKDDLDREKKHMSEFLHDYYPDNLMASSKFKNKIREIVRDELRNEVSKAPDWLVKIIRETIEHEVKNNLKINLSGYEHINVELTYKGRSIASASKYHPRG